MTTKRKHGTWWRRAAAVVAAAALALIAAPAQATAGALIDETFSAQTSPANFGFPPGRRSPAGS